MSSRWHLLIEFRDFARSSAPTLETCFPTSLAPRRGPRAAGHDGMMESPFLSSIFTFFNDTSAERGGLQRARFVSASSPGSFARRSRSGLRLDSVVSHRALNATLPVA